MLFFESDHYIFHYRKGSVAENEVENISTLQEACYAYLCRTLNVSLGFKLNTFFVIRRKKSVLSMGTTTRATASQDCPTRYMQSIMTT